MSQVVRALRPFKVQVSIGEFLHFKTGDRIPHDLLTGPYREYVMGHCEIANTKVAGYVPVAEPERTIEPTSKLKTMPPPLKEQWKNAPNVVQNVSMAEEHQSVKATSTPHGGAAMAKQATGAAPAAPHTHGSGGKGSHTGKAKGHG